MTSASQAVQAALVAALAGHAEIADVVTGIYDGPPPRAAFPYVAIDDGGTSDWSHKTGRGREHRIGVVIWDDGEAPTRLHGLVAAAQDAIEIVARDLGDHRIVSLIFVRSRILRDPDGTWAGIVQYRARTLEI